MMRGAWLCALVAQTAMAAAPVLTELRPRGAAIGQPFVLTAIGRNLGEGAHVISNLPASFTPVGPPQTAARMGGSMSDPGHSVSFLVEPDPHAVPGVYPIRIESAGISNVLLFTLGTYPEVTEEESQPGSRAHSNDTIETAEPVRPAPVVVNGTLVGPERDVYRVSGKAGERRVFEVESRRSGSAIDPVLRILDGSGKQLARNDDAAGAGLDARVDFTFPADGNYYVEVTDARFSTQAQNFYRLKMGDYRYANGVFPLGGKRGERVAITYFGGNLPASVNSSADLGAAAKDEAFTHVALPGSPALPFLFAVSDLPELREPVAGPVPIPSVVNGRLDRIGEIDRYHYRVEPGQKLIFELQARELGTSRLEGILTVFDSAGKKLASAGDQPLPEDVFAVQGTSRTSSDPFLNFTAPPDAHELVVSVEDLASRGGPLYGYRLIARQQAEDFTLTVNSPFINIPAGGTAAITVTATRRGYDGPIQLTIPNLPKGMHVEGGTIPREYVDASNARTINRRGVLTITADRGVTMTNGQLEVWGEGAVADGSVFRRRAKGSGMTVDVAGATEQGAVDRQRALTAPWLGWDLPAALTDPPVAVLEVRQTGIKQMAEGARYEFAYQWTVRGTATPPKQLNVDVVGAKDIRVIDMTSKSFAVTTSKATDPGRYDVYVNARIRTEDGDEVVVARAIPFEVIGGTRVEQ